MPFLPRRFRAMRPATRCHREAGRWDHDRARRAIACLVVAAEILVMAWAGAGAVSIECRFVSPLGEHRIGVTARITRGPAVEKARHIVVPACPGLATTGS